SASSPKRRSDPRCCPMPHRFPAKHIVDDHLNRNGLQNISQHATKGGSNSDHKPFPVRREKTDEADLAFTPFGRGSLFNSIFPWQVSGRRQPSPSGLVRTSRDLHKLLRRKATRPGIYRKGRSDILRRFPE